MRECPTYKCCQKKLVSQRLPWSVHTSDSGVTAGSVVLFHASVSTVNNKVKTPPGAEELVGKAVEHLFEKEDGEKNEWRGMVLSKAPVMTNWYYITYEKDPVLYMYQLWDDYAEGDLRILPEAGIANFCKNL